MNPGALVMNKSLMIGSGTPGACLQVLNRHDKSTAGATHLAVRPRLSLQRDRGKVRHHRQPNKDPQVKALMRT
ncbi:hypothetical protein GCM10010387_56510 [Streptomyces inusitatus]|uniref:Uncharacterized protein n=1 Tax=Streptomyces inusitatus TaxID=68221 RepID=A0A918QMT9_9ACTN|nr:hypothetical protein GCM10010387_56510 [Streptomyces inusitatus]